MSPPWTLGLARWAAELDRDLQAATRRVGGGHALWSASPDVLRRALRLEPERAGDVLQIRRDLDAVRALEDLGRQGIAHVALGDPRFPSSLASIADPPFGLFARGDVSGLARAVEGPAVAIVGSRRATSAGLAFARVLARDLASRGAAVVSGLALGIDAAAHLGALDAGGCTIAVLGTGVDVAYPRRHANLAGRIVAEEGLLVSEFWPGTAPAPWRFPARNRIVAGLSDAVVVVEAGERSGALITADLALEGGIPVLAVPGAPHAAASRGCNALIRAGAALCEGAEDVISEVPHARWAPPSATQVAQRPDGLAGRIYDSLLLEPLRVDEIAAQVGVEPGAVSAALARLEVDGLAVRGEGQRFWAAPLVGAA